MMVTKELFWGGEIRPEEELSLDSLTPLVGRTIRFYNGGPEEFIEINFLNINQLKVIDQVGAAISEVCEIEIRPKQVRSLNASCYEVEVFMCRSHKTDRQSLIREYSFTYQEGFFRILAANTRVRTIRENLFGIPMRPMSFIEEIG